MSYFDRATDRPTDRGVISGDRSSACVQKIRGNITGYRSGFDSAREEELIPALAVISHPSMRRRASACAVSLLRLRINVLMPFFSYLTLRITNFKHVINDELHQFMSDNDYY